MSLALRALRYWIVPGGWLLLAACGAEPGDPAPVQSESEWQARQRELADEAAREQQARQDAQTAELQQAVLAIESDPPDTLSEEQFYRELEYYCGACHFPAPIPPGGEAAYWLFFDDLQHMIERSRVIPGDAEGSPIIAHMRADQTPPQGWNTPPVTDIAIQLVSDFINQLPAKSEASASGG